MLFRLKKVLINLQREAEKKQKQKEEKSQGLKQYKSTNAGEASDIDRAQIEKLIEDQTNDPFHSFVKSPLTLFSYLP